MVDSPAAVPRLMFNISAVVQKADAASYSQWLAVQPIHFAADRKFHFSADASHRTLLDFSRSVETDYAVGRPLPQHFREEDGAIPSRAAADIVTRIDEDHRRSRHFQGLAHRGSGIRKRPHEPLSRLP